MVDVQSDSGSENASPEISHARAKRLISFAWDGEISAAEVEQLSRHLRRCPECAAASNRMVAFLRRLDACFSRRPPEPPDES